MTEKLARFYTARLRVLALTSAAMMALASSPALTAPLNPNDFTSLGSLSGGAISIDTDALTINGGAGGVLVSQGSGLPDIAVYAFAGGSVLGNVTVSGSNPLAILFQGSGTIAGNIDVSGGLPSQSSNIPPNEQIPGYGVAGGANGGVGSNFYSVAGNGGGTGGGEKGGSGGSTDSPGAGGSFGSPGADAFTVHAGPTYGDLTNALEGGSGGGGGGKSGYFANTSPPSGGGGAGGGAIELGALTDLIFAATADIEANGSRGGNYGSDGGGGGSGGGVLIHSYNIDIMLGAIIAANGGDPGKFGQAGQAGCGGAGRIAILYNASGSYTNGGTVEAIPGDDTSATNSGTACHPTNPLNVVNVLSSPNIGIAPAVAGTTPLPAALPLFATGLGAFGLLGWRRKRKKAAAIAA